MPTTTRNFLKPRLTGDRFLSHTIPLEVLSDLSVLRPMVIEISKAKFFEENPNRKRVPRGYGEGVSIQLKGIEAGSAIPELVMEFDSSTAEPVEISYYEQARDTIISAVRAASKDQDVLEHLDRQYLGYFDKLGRNLEPNEAIHFGAANDPDAAILTRETRDKLVEASRIDETSEGMILRGGVVEFDQENMTCQIALASGERLGAKVPSTHFDIVMTAFSLLKTENIRMSFEGVVRLNRQKVPKYFEEIHHITLIEPNDVAYRLDEISLLRDGWFDGEGVAFEKKQLTEIGRLFELYSPDDLTAPNGELLAEWSLEGGHEASLEIHLGSNTGELTLYNLNNEEEEEPASISLADVSGWELLSQKLLIS